PIFHSGDGTDRVLDSSRHVAGNRAAGCRKRHVDLYVPVIVDIDLINKSKFVDVHGDLGIVDRLEGGHHVVGETVEFLLRDGAGLGTRQRRPAFRRLRLVARASRHVQYVSLRHGTLPHPKNVAALRSASASRSTSSRVLYMPNDARQVAVTPNLAISGSQHWVPARTATPDRSMIVEMSCGCAPS